ncbi:zinc finger BED domain-containing protein RICESLEEPER 2-like [Salvia divinorum]|uniref:Zinc finger BED domain-containing protein RICESLEEPER 2-like n=1 Tax=Salvia divinorum TaxID=28513 RepID=A0ABD1GWX7_SALDI
MCTNIGTGSSSSLGDCGETEETPTLASETPQMLDDVGALAMEIAESPNLNTAKPPKPNLKRKQRKKTKDVGEILTESKSKFDPEHFHYCKYYNDKFDLDKNGNSTSNGQNCDFTNADSVAVVEEFNLLDVDSLKPSNAEAIICTRDWLFGEKAIKREIPTNDLAEDFLNVDDEPQTGSSMT